MRWLLVQAVHDHVIVAVLAALLFIGVVLLVVTAIRMAAGWVIRESETRFHTLAEAIPLIVWTAVPGQGIDYRNHRWGELTGQSMDRIRGAGWKDGLHPDDLPVAEANWEKGRQTGAPVEAEYRLRTASGDYRWHLVRATPMKDPSGKIVKWFGCSFDIDDQMRHQQLLEERIKEHTAALMDANERLESEMRERALAQQELNQQNETMLRELTKRSNRATTLAKTAELLQSCTELKDIVSVTSGMAPKAFPELRGAVFLFNSSRDTVELAASWAQYQAPASVFVPQDCWALRTGHLHIVPAGDSTARCRHVLPGEGSYFCLPLLSQGESIGILHFATVNSPELPDSMVNMANTFAEQVGLSVANLRLPEALRNQSIRDSLTGLFNRRYLEETLEREIRRAIRSEQSLGLMMLDLDHFKNFNDTYGHEAGDAILRETASFLIKSVRAEDIVCRFGGEEFVVILPMATMNVTKARAERIRSKFHELTVLHQGRSLGMVTASLGVAALPEHGTERGALIQAVDAALYRAKREGRDRVVIAELSSTTAVQASHVRS